MVAQHQQDIMLGLMVEILHSMAQPLLEVEEVEKPQEEMVALVEVVELLLVVLEHLVKVMMVV